MLKRVLSLSVAAALFLSILLSGCTNKESSTANSNVPSSSTPGASQKEELKPVDIVWFSYGWASKEQEAVFNEVSKYTKEKINATVKQTVAGGSAVYKDKLTMMIASGEQFDICFTAGWLDYSANVAKGAFLEIDALLDQYGKDIKKIMPDALLNGSKINGKNYGLPAIKEIAHQWGIEYKKEFADKYKFDMSKVKTLDDLEPLFKTIKDNEPGLVPFAIMGKIHPFGTLPFSKIGDSSIPGSIYTNKSELKVVNEYDTPEAKEYFKLMRKFYNAGYIRKDAATLQDLNADVTTGKYFASLLSYTPYAEISVSSKRGYDIGFVPLMKPAISTSDCVGSMQAISRTSINPERAMMFLNLLNTDKELRTLVNLGIEGKHYVKVGENNFKYPDGVDTKSLPYSSVAYTQGNMFLTLTAQGTPADIWEKYEEFNQSADVSPDVGFSFDPTPVKTEVAAVQNVYNEFMPGLLTGSLDSEEYLPKALDKFKVAGSDKIIAEMQRQLDAFAASKQK